MSELNLPACPIGHGRNRLSRETMARAGQTCAWDECRECGSILLWTGNNEWAYQEIGRPDKRYLLKQAMTPPEPSALAVDINRRDVLGQGDSIVADDNATGQYYVKLRQGDLSQTQPARWSAPETGSQGEAGPGASSRCCRP